jgi:hypothetical protein
MGTPRKIALGVLALVACGALVLLRMASDEPGSVEATRRALRQQGFKTDLADFDFSATAECCARAEALTDVPRSREPVLMVAEGSNSAAVLWKEASLPETEGQQLLPAIEETLEESKTELDAARDAALSGPLRFPLEARQGPTMLLPHLAALKNDAQLLGARAIVELRNEKREAAWTDLLAVTRLVSAWNPEPAEVSHLVRFNCVGTAFDVTWQVLQAPGWSDQQLLSLRREWEAVDFFKGLPETAAFARAGMVALCQLERRQPPGPRMAFTALRQSPRAIWSELARDWREYGYRHYGTYRDEKALLLYYRDRELALQRAVQSPTWAEMRQLPGVTNQGSFQSERPYSRLQMMLNQGRLARGWQMRGVGLLGMAAEAEARRRLILAAIALEHYHNRRGSYPERLEELAPEYLKSPPTDFMDGKPLRYRLLADGHFILYSVGLDTIDHGGTMPPRQSPAEIYRRSVMPGAAAEPGDLVWPRPASASAVRSSS